ncbi:hypothetical protein ACJX0J_024676, partial [Zea mays]
PFYFVSLFYYIIYCALVEVTNNHLRVYLYASFFATIMSTYGTILHTTTLSMLLICSNYWKMENLSARNSLALLHTTNYSLSRHEEKKPHAQFWWYLKEIYFWTHLTYDDEHNIWTYLGYLIDLFNLTKN